MRISALVESFVGMVNVKLPAVIVCDPNVCTDTAFLPAAVELYTNTASKGVVKVTFVQLKLALGVQYAVVPDVVGAVALVTVTPPAT